MIKWTLSRRILFIGVGLGALTVLQGALSLSSMYRTRRVVTALHRDTFATLYLTGQMKAAAKDQQLAILLDIAATNQQDLPIYEAQVEDAGSAFTKLGSQYPTFDASDRDAIAQLSDAQASLDQVWTQIKSLTRAGKKQEALDLYNSKLQDLALTRSKLSDQLGETDKQQDNQLVGAAIANLGQGIPAVWLILIFTVVVGTTGAFSFAHLVTRSIKPLEAAIQLLGKGVLHGNVDIHGADDLGYMAANMNGALEQMTATVSGIDYCSDKIASATNDILTRTARSAESAISQRDQIRQIGDSMQQMVENVQRVSEDSHLASDSADNAVEIARQGGIIVSDALSNMRTIADSVNATAQKIQELGKSSDQIGKIVAVINEIAEQTNLLALNAAIEAARAGEHGRGFSVVAGEVRRLAERTTSATKDIAHMIQSVQTETQQAVGQMQAETEQVEAGVASTSRAGASLEQIISAAQEVGARVARISEAANRQDGSAKQINANVEQIARITSESAEDVQESTSTCQSLSELTNSLKEIISQFHFRQIIGEASTH